MAGYQAPESETSNDTDIEKADIEKQDEKGDTTKDFEVSIEPTLVRTFSRNESR